jgi:S1-C subfamily serine protease
MTLTISREGKQQDVRVSLGQLTPETARAQEQGGAGGEGAGRLGISVVPITPELAAQLGLQRGTQGLVIQDIDPAGPAAQAGLKAGDVIEQVNRQPVHTVQDMRRALQSSGNRPPLLVINRGGQSVFVPVPLQ